MPRLRTAPWLALLLALAACGGGNAKRRQSCQSDNECSGRVCFEQACYTACTGPASCSDDEQCVHRTAGALQADLCVTAAEFADCSLDGTCTADVVGDDAATIDALESIEPYDVPPANDAGSDDAGSDDAALEVSDTAPEADAPPGGCDPACVAPAACFDGVCQADPQVRPHFAGTYRVQTDLDVAGALPAAPRARLQLLIAALADPSTALLVHACDLAGTAAADLCQQAFVTPDAPDVDALTPLGQAIRDHVQAWVSVQVPEWQPGGVPGLEAALDTAFGAVRLGATFGLGSDPSPADGTISTSGATWDKASLRWPFRVACPTTDDACGRLEVDLLDLGSGKLGQAFGSKAVQGPTGWTFDVQTHTFTLWIGKIVAWLFWGNVLPEVYGDGSDSQPYVDSWLKLVRASLAGQRACLDVGNCCELFANAIVEVEPSATVSLLLDACEALAAEDPVRDVGEVDLTENNLTLTTDPSVPCRFHDLDADGTTDAFGLPQPPAKRCAWWFFWSAGTAVSVPNTFWATP